MPLGYGALESNVSERLSNITEAETNIINNFLDVRKMDLLSLSKKEVFREFLENFENRDILVKYVNKQLLDEKSKSEFFDEFFVLSPDGTILANTQQGYTPQDIFKEFDFYHEKEGLVYVKPLRFCYCIEKYVLDITTPIYKNKTNEIIGLVVARIYFDNLKNITWGNLGLGDIEKVYVVSGDGLLVSSSDLSSSDLSNGKYFRFVQNVDNENARKCFSSNVFSGENQDNVFAKSFLNYLGDEVVGTHKYLSELDWCILVESNISAIEGLRRNLFKKNILISFVVIFFFSFISYLLGRYLDKKNEVKNDKKQAT